MNASGVYELCCLLQRSIGRSITLCRDVCLFGIDCYILAACNSVLLHSLTFQKTRNRFSWKKMGKTFLSFRFRKYKMFRMHTKCNEYRQNAKNTDKMHRVLTKCFEPSRTSMVYQKTATVIANSYTLLAHRLLLKHLILSAWSLHTAFHAFY